MHSGGKAVVVLCADVKQDFAQFGFGEIDRISLRLAPKLSKPDAGQLCFGGLCLGRIQVSLYSGLELVAVAGIRAIHRMEELFAVGSKGVPNLKLSNENSGPFLLGTFIITKRGSGK